MTPLVWLPGMMCDARLFAPQRVVFGGEVILSTTHASVSDMAKDVLMQAPARFALAGLSMGGIIAMEVIRQAPDRVERVALMDTNPKAEDANVAAKREPQMAAVKAGKLDAVMREEMKPNYLTDGPQRGAILDLCMNMAMDLGPQAFINQSRALQHRPDQQATLRSYNKPALVLCGVDDALCPVHRHTLMHELLPRSTLQVIENAGHLPTLEKPDETNAALRRWLEDPDG